VRDEYFLAHKKSTFCKSNRTFASVVILKKLLIVLFFLTNILSAARAQNDTAHINKKRLIPLVAGVNLTYAGSLIYLSQAWYKNDPRTHFHFFDDNAEWLQLDKCGHLTTSFHESVFAVEALKWSGVSKKKAIIFGSFAGLLYQTPIEIFDGFSSAYGASWGDEMANASGSLLVLGQYLLWDQIRFQPKFSFHHSGLASLNPNLLGKNSVQQILKDYNGQTYWMSFNIHSFLKNKESCFPRWLNLAIGYGGNNMIFARKYQNKAVGFIPYRQYYLSFDVDMRYVKTKKKWIKYLLYPLNFIHIPFPSVEFNKKGIKFSQ
jgi:hypothetical protein